MKYHFFIYTVILLVLTQCQNVTAEKEPVFIERDTTITPQNAVTKLVLDSNGVEAFIQSKSLDDRLALQMRSFYNSRNYQYAWFTENGLAEQAQAFWNLHNQHMDLSKDSSGFDKELHSRMETLQDTVTLDTKTMINTELQLTQHFFEFTTSAYAGKLDPAEMQWHIPRKKLDAVLLLDSLVKTKGENLEKWEPVSQQYRLLKNELLRYYNIQTEGEWKQVELKSTSLKKGEKSSVLTDIKHNLFLIGDLSENDSTSSFDTTLQEAVKGFQNRFGLQATGRIDAAFIKALNITPEKRIEQMLINLERMRWLPVNENDSRIMVNIPEFKLHVYEGDQEALTMDIVVGKEGTKTVIFSDKLKHIVFSPYWNVPPGIMRNEILPAMKRNSSYLARNNMEVYGNSGGMPLVRQKPGGNNALGKVKFLFPNRYNIYLHDTPAKTLFQRNTRAFSHGCIRISQPFEMAAYLLRNDAKWTEEKIQEAMNRDKETWVNLKAPLPVYISYFTAWVDNDGKLNFRDDIYGHDKQMAERLFTHSLEHV